MQQSILNLSHQLSSRFIYSALDHTSTSFVKSQFYCSCFAALQIYKKHALPPPSPPPPFLEQKLLFLDLLTLFMKPFKTSDFSKHISHILTWWYYTSQTCYNKVYLIQKSLWTSYVRVNPVKWNSQTCIHEKNHSDCKICQKLIILKV